MSTELLYLTWSAALCVVLWIPYIVARTNVWGLVDAVGYPDDPPVLPKWAQRAYRAHLNTVENLVPFAALVLVANAADISNASTVLGAALFFWARIAQVIVHVAGIPWLRTISFVVGWLGMALIFFQIIAA